MMAIDLTNLLVALLVTLFATLLAALILGLLATLAYRFYSSKVKTRWRLHRRAWCRTLNIRLWQLRGRWEVYCFFRRVEVKNLISDRHELKDEWSRLAKLANGIFSPLPLASDFYRQVQRLREGIKTFENEEETFAKQLRELEKQEQTELSRAASGLPASETAREEELILKPVSPGVFSLPPRPKNFTDRDEDLEKLKAWLGQGQDKSVLSLTAPMGRGKTYLAAKLYYEAQNNGRKVCWIDCRSPLVTLDSLLSSFVSNFTVEQEDENDAPPHEDPRARQFAIITDPTYPDDYRLDALIRLLEEADWLIVLDNYHLAENKGLDELVIAIEQKAARTKLLLIGRREPAVLDGLPMLTAAEERLPLSPLPRAFARSYLNNWRHLKELSDELAGEIWEKCDGEPIAMNIFASLVRQRSATDLLQHELPNWSSHAKAWLDGLTEALTDEESKALQAACIFSEPPERTLLEAVCAINSIEDAPKAVAGLIDTHLLQRDENTERLTLHDALRDYWHGQLRGSISHLHLRAAHWLDNRRNEIKRQQTSDVTKQWNESIRVTWGNYTQRCFHHYTEAYEPATALIVAEDLWIVTEARSSHLCAQALKQCELIDDNTARARWLRRETELLYDNQQIEAEEAEVRYNRSLELSRADGDTAEQARTEIALGKLRLKSTRWDEAADYANHARLLSQQVGGKVIESDAVSLMASVEEAFGQFPKAMKLLKEAVSLRQAAGPEDGDLDNEIEQQLENEIVRIKEVRRGVSMRTILTTVGTSLLSNAKRDMGVAQPDAQQLADYLRGTEAARASAETNSLSRLLTPGDERVIFLYSQTGDGKACAEALAEHYREQEYETQAIEVSDLNYTESQFKMRGLRALVAALVEQIQQAKAEGREALINATGGFKAETAYATLVGLLFKVPVYYIHEAFQEIIEMPPTPIGWDYSLMEEHAEFFRWIEADLRPTEQAEARVRAMLPEARNYIRSLLAEEEGFTLLSPVGEAFYQAFRARS